MSKTLTEIKDSLPADRREKIQQRYDALVDELREIVAENERLRAERDEAVRLLGVSVHYVWEYGPGDLRDEIEAFLAKLEKAGE